MPKIVDHEARRHELLPAVWAVLGREGVNGLTIRSIARETGWSVGVLQHYFPTKRDMIVSAHELAYARAGERIRTATVGKPALVALEALMEEALPLDGERLLEARIEVSAWQLAAADAEFRALHQERVQGFMAEVTAMIGRGRTEGIVCAKAPDELLAHGFIALIDSLSLQAVLSPELVPPSRQRELVRLLLQSLTTV